MDAGWEHCKQKNGNLTTDYTDHLIADCGMQIAELKT